MIGSNSGDRLSQLKMAGELIGKEIGSTFVKSTIYETAPWGKTDQPHFLNQLIKTETRLSPDELLVKIQYIEQILGRTRVEKWGERSIDIDIIYFGDKIINTSALVIPHPHLTKRKFVLIPLSEVGPEFIHPVLRKSNAQLLKECTDTLSVKEFID